MKKLYEAVTSGDLDAVQALFKESEGLVRINETNEIGRTALHVAAMAGHVEIAKYLFDQGAKINEKDNNNQTPLHLAAKHAPQESGMVEFLCGQNGVDINPKDNQGKTPLLLTPLSNSKTIQHLIESGAEVRIIQTPGRSFVELCRPQPASLRAVLITAPNCLVTPQNKLNQRLIHNLIRKVPKYDPNLMHFHTERGGLYTPTVRKMIGELLQARIKLTEAYVCLFQAEPTPGEIAKKFNEALTYSRSLVVQEITAIINDRHQLLRNNKQVTNHLVREIGSLLSDLAKETLKATKEYLTSPDPPAFEKFTAALIHASKLSYPTVTAEIDAIHSSNPTLFANALIKIASTNPPEGSDQINHLLNYVGNKLRENYIDTISLKNDTRQTHLTENLQISLLCQLSQKPPDHSGELLYNLSALISEQIGVSAKGLNLTTLIEQHPDEILTIIGKLEKQYESITGTKLGENFTSPCTELKERAIKAKRQEQTPLQNGDTQNTSSNVAHDKENSRQLSLPQWAKKHIEQVNQAELVSKALKQFGQVKEPEPSTHESPRKTPKTSPR